MGWLRIKGIPDPILKGRIHPGILSFQAEDPTWDPKSE